MSLRLDDEEFEMREALAERHGISGSGVMRQALRRWAREEGISAGAARPEAPGSKRRKEAAR